MRNKLIWLLVGTVMLLTLLNLVGPRGDGNGSPQKAAQKVAAIPPPKVEQRPPRPPPQPHEWKVLHHFPRAGQTEQSRQVAVRVFFNRPVEPEVAERAFRISPSVRGTFSWPAPDRLVFTPGTALPPATQYTVSLRPRSGSRAGVGYKLLEARWSFTTGDVRTYERDIKPLIAAYCSKCHGPTGPAEGMPLETYRDVNRYVVSHRSDVSPLYTFLQDRRHHINMAGPAHSTNDKLAIIRDWIDEDGAAR